METLMLVAAGAAFAIACVTVLAVSVRGRRPPLRLPREDALAERDRAGLIDALGLTPESPIDRGGTVSDLEPIEPAPRRPDGGAR